MQMGFGRKNILEDKERTIGIIIKDYGLGFGTPYSDFWNTCRHSNVGHINVTRFALDAL